MCGAGFFLISLSFEVQMASCTRRQSTFTVAPVALNSPLDHSAVCLSSHTA